MGRNGKGIPLYVHIHRTLRDGILSGKFPPGTLLPSENSLCDQHDTSRCTVRSSLKKLDAEGLVRNLPGRGWEVLGTEGRSLGPRHGILAFIGRGDIESARTFEVVRKVCRPHFSDVRHHVKPHGQDPAWYDEFMKTEVEGGTADEVIVFDDKPLPEAFALSLKSAKIPLLCLPLNGNYPYDSIGTDNLMASEIMLTHLLERGHRNIIFATSGELDMLPSFSLRRTGYALAMERQGLIPEIIVARHNYWQGQEEEALIMGKIRAMTSDGRPPTCIFCSGPTPVVEFLAILTRNGIDVPGDMSVCSFGCSPESPAIASRFGIGSLTHMEEQFDAMGQVAVEILALKGESSIPVSILVAAVLKAGDSVVSLKSPRRRSK